MARPVRTPGHFLEWRPDLILLRSILSAVIVSLVIEAVILRDAGRTVSMLAAVLLAVCAICILVSWRTIYFAVIRMRARRYSGSTSDSIRLWVRAARLLYATKRAQINRVQFLIRDLDRLREPFPYFLESTGLRYFIKSMFVIVVRGPDNPLAALIFADSLKAIGFRVAIFDDFPLEDGENALRDLETERTERVAVIVGDGVREHAISRLVSAFVEGFGPGRVVALPLFSVSKSGMSFFNQDHLSELPTNFYLALKNYLERAASLSKSPEDFQFDRRGDRLPPNFR